MNDRYLFKAKRKNWQQLPEDEWWVIGYYQQRFDIHGKKKHLIYVCKSHLVWEYVEIDITTLCQCTGLKDKNGNLIWENDVVMCNIEECSGYVAWNESECGFYFIAVFDDGTRDVEPLCDYANELEVIGSIFDNPELLEVE